MDRERVEKIVLGLESFSQGIRSFAYAFERFLDGLHSILDAVEEPHGEED